MRLTSSGFSNQRHEGEKRCLNSELWHACAGPIVSLPIGGSCVVYFPQGHSEQVSASNNKEVDAHIPNYPSLPPQLICQLHDVTMHADVETDEVYAQMTLQPLSPQDQKDAYLSTELDTPSKQPNNYFCKTLTASDTSTHGGFSVPRRAAEKVFPPLDFTQQPPAQELIARDLHDNEWKFRHIFRGQPKRHLLTTGWSIFISAKRLVAGDSVLFIWNEKNQLLLGIRRAHRPQTVLPSSVLSSDSMHIGLLAAAAHAAATSSRFTIFYNPRASPSEFVISLAKYAKAVYHTHVSVGMRFRMLFETEEASVRRYMGTITGISDLDPVRWSNSYWRSVKVGWDESTAGERQPRVSLWDIEPLTTFPMYPSPFSLRLKRPWPPGLPFLHGGRDDEMGLKSPLMWLRGDGTDREMQALNFKDMGVTPWTQTRFDSSLLGLQHEVYQAVGAAALQEMRNVDLSNQVPLGLQPDLYQAMGVEGLQEMRNVVPMKQALPSLLQFQQPHTGPNGCAVLQRQILQQVQSQSPQIFLQNILENQNQAQSQLHLIQQLQQQHTFNGQQQQLQHHSFNGQQQQLQHTHSFMDQKLQRQQQLQLLDKKQMPTVVTSFSQLASASQSEAPSLKSISSIGYQQLFPGCNGTSMSGLSPLQSILGSFSSGDTAHLHNLPRTSPPIPSSTWLQKEATVDSLLPSGPHPIGTQMDLLDPSQLNSSHHSMWLPPLPGRECSLDQESGTDPTQSNLLFGVSIDSASLLMQNGISSLRSVGSETDSTSMPFAASNYLDGLGSDFSLNPATNSSCLGESGIFQSPEHVGQENPPSRTFVKVYKSGSFGRSLDMTKFSSYQELRNELAQMFSIEGQLEDPQRSGWQLVFVDRENDVLLLGDDPWQEFVDNVWCIKILSPQEVQQMAKQGIELLSAVPIQRLASGNCNDHVS